MRPNKSEFRGCEEYYGPSWELEFPNGVMANIVFERVQDAQGHELTDKEARQRFEPYVKDMIEAYP